MSAADPITRAHPLYRAALSHPHKSGAAFMEFAPRRTLWTVLGSIAVSLAGWAGFFCFVGWLLSLRGA